MYNWTGGCTNDTCNNLCPGYFTVTVTDAFGCSVTIDTSITEPAVLAAAILNSVNASCHNACDGSATCSASGGTSGAGYSYSWNITQVQTNAIATGLCAGSYSCTVTDANNCSAITTVTISEPPLVVISPITNLIICPGSNATLAASASGGNPGGYNYSWDAPGNSGFANTALVTVSPAGTTTFTVNATDSIHNCPAAPVTVSVSISLFLTLDVSDIATICNGDSSIISAIASNGNGGPYTYSWSPSGSLNNPSINNPTATPNITTTYIVTGNDGCSPPVIDSVTIVVLPLPVVNFTVDIDHGCAPLCVNFTDASTVTGDIIASRIWDFGDGTLISNSQNLSHCFNNPGQYSITSKVTTNSGCVASYTNINMISVFAKPIAAFTPSPNPASIIDPEITMNTSFSSNVNYWYWNFGDGDTLAPNSPNPTHQYSTTVESSYTVTLIIHNANDCYDTVSHEIVIGPEFTFYIPNSFTPNEDGTNDYFGGAGTGISKYSLWIFDRWGNMIFYSSELYDKWNGKSNHGRDISQLEVYVWKAEITDIFNKKHDYIGTVTLVK